tara:strand:+ start:4788 stop:6836 length:2049 start_codon:yes stop_codon:yes gene_type:complete
MKMKHFGKYSLHLCAGLLGATVLLLPVQATVAVPVPAMKPDIAVNTVISPTFKNISTDVKMAHIIPVPDMKPVFDIEPGAGADVAEDDNVQAYALKLLKLTSLMPAETVDQNQKIRTQQYAHGYQPLSSHESKLYTKIFDLQLHGNWDESDITIGQIKDQRLMGHVLYQRYMHPSYKSSFSELKVWLDAYADHPGADKIHKLALSKQGEDESQLMEPKSTRILSQIKEPTIYYPQKYKIQTKRNHAQNIQVRDFSRQVRALVRTGKTQAALDFLTGGQIKSIMDNAEIDSLKSRIAAGFLYRGDIETARALAMDASVRSGQYVPNASWIAGLALWQQHDYTNAAVYFEKTGQSPYASGWRSSAGYYWAARSYGRVGDRQKLRSALTHAAKHSRTFYGLIATKMLGQAYSFNWHAPDFDRNAEALVLSTDAGQRAFSLVAAGQYDLAEDELMRLQYRGNMELRRAVLAYAMRVGLPGIALRLGNMVQAQDGHYYDAALYPIAPWEPQDGFVVDPALIHAVMRQESRFNQQAKSYSGALGLMQIMPKTAQYVAQKHGYTQIINNASLSDPAVNMTVGQDYIDYLLKGKYVHGDIISLLVAYNAGPGNLLKWRKRSGDTADPLLFVEMLPVQETRDYVVKVMSNYWIYRLRAGLDVPSLASLASGQAPRYAHVMQTQTPYKLSSK